MTRTCYIDGCDFEGDLSGLRGHHNASKSPPEGDHPPWSEAKRQYYGNKYQGEPGDGRQTEGGPEGGKEAENLSGSQETGADDQATEGDEGPETPENRENDQADEDPLEGPSEGGSEEDDQDMPTDEELDRQRDQATEGASEGGSGSGTNSDNNSSKGGGEGGLPGVPIPVSTTTLAIGAALVLMLLVLYLYHTSGGFGGGSEPTPETSDDQGGTSDVPDQRLVDDLPEEINV